MTTAALHDCLIVGGGIAGLSAALYAHSLGLSCIIFEPQLGCIDKACGEGLMPPALARLGELNLTLKGGQPFKGIRYFHPLGVTTADLTATNGLGIRRIRLHQALLAEVSRLRIPMVSVAVHSVEQLEQHCMIGGYAGRYVLLCTGLRSRLRRQLGFTYKRYLKPRFGTRQHFTTTTPSTYVEVYWGRDFELYVTPIAKNEVGVACLARKPKQLRELIKLFPTLEQKLGPPTTQLRGSGPFEHRVNTTYKGRVFLVGDAAGYIDPLTGEGLHLALASAKLATQCIKNGTQLSYHTAWLKLTRRYRLMTLALLYLTHFWFGRYAVFLSLRISPRLLALGLRLLIGPSEKNTLVHHLRTSNALK